MNQNIISLSQEIESGVFEISGAIEERQEELNEVYFEIFPELKPQNQQPQPLATTTLDDQKVIEFTHKRKTL